MLKLYLSDRFAAALQFAFEKHRKQLRKGSGVPYMSHLLSVCALVMEHGGDEDEAIAALLHDVVEDQAVTLEELRLRFGDRVADIVAGCTKEKVDWKLIPPEKVWETMLAGHKSYFAHLKSSFDPIRRVSACDKLHNSRDILKDLKAGRDIFKKMKGGPGGTLWYYEQLADIFSTHGPVSVGKEIAEVCPKIRAFVPTKDLLEADGVTRVWDGLSYNEAK